MRKFKDPFHKIKEKLSKFLDHTSSTKPINPPSDPIHVMVKSSFLGLGRKRGSDPPLISASESSCPNWQGSSSMFPRELQADVAQVNSLLAHLHMKCWSCHAALPLEIDSHVAEWLSGTQVIPPTSQISALQCAKCQELTCVGCGKLPKFNKHNFFTSLGVVNHCCYEGRLFGVWILLSRFDKAEISEKKPASKLVERKAPARKPKSKKQGPAAQNGVGYNSGSGGYPEIQDDYSDPGSPISDGDLDEIFLAGGMPVPHPLIYMGHYGSMNGQTYAAQEQKSKARDEKTKAQDQQFVDTLKLLAAFLPGTGSPSGPLEEIKLYRLSFLFDKIAGLLRNDSIVDISNRKALYTQVFEFVQAIANVPELVGLVLDERVDKSHCFGLDSINRSDSQRGSFSIHAGFLQSSGIFSSSVLTGSHDTYRQAKSFLAISKMPQAGVLPQELVSTVPGFASAIGSAEEDKRDSEATVRMCERIIVLYECLHEARPTSAVEDQTDIWTKYAEENRVTFDEDVLTNHRFLADINNLRTSVTKNRLATIGKEVATLTTSLPPGIFVKVAESRSDAMKVLIVGPEGTPYAHGLFIFDLFLDASYPLSPPKVAFVLDGNDNEAHPFNPNLHRGGSVCLSLLNTWEGSPNEMWQPNKSTILSVLISIQAMILGAEVPWINEPGFAHQESSSQAKEHRLLIQTKTVKYAMIAWLENQFSNTKSREYIWKEVSQTYWKHNGIAAFDTVKDWIPGNPALIGSVPAIKKKKGKNKDKDIQQPDVGSMAGGQDLVEKLAQCLGLPIDNLSHKRKLSSAGTSKDSKKHKSEPSDDTVDATEMKWYYKGAKTTKAVRAACKEFGLGSGPTIDACISKLETHVNGKGKASEELVEKWGEMREVERAFI